MRITSTNLSPYLLVEGPNNHKTQRYLFGCSIRGVSIRANGSIQLSSRGGVKGDDDTDDEKILMGLDIFELSSLPSAPLWRSFEPRLVPIDSQKLVVVVVLIVTRRGRLVKIMSDATISLGTEILVQPWSHLVMELIWKGRSLEVMRLVDGMTTNWNVG